MAEYKLKPLPPETGIENRDIWKHLVEAHRALAELKGFAKTISNQEILINAIGILEAKDNSEIEHIRSSLDDICFENVFGTHSFSTEDIWDCFHAMNRGYELVREDLHLSVNQICDIQQVLESFQSGLRMETGTVIRSPGTGKIMYIPPQDFGEIMDLFRNYEQVINDDDFWPDTDPLIKMAVAHYQFENIHPFYDGNGRTGRILNVLYLIMKGLLDAPILNLSRFIVKNSQDYYRLFRELYQKGDLNGVILFMLDAVVEASRESLRIVQEISRAMEETRRKIEGQRFCSPALLDALFLLPYTRTELFAQRLGVHRTTAAARLKALVELGVLEKRTYGQIPYYVNRALFDVLSE
ncbi:MAG: Fic family protein [Thermoguttaceae bacterium]|nr:Fic family protein [Thermoguttaceae bacterium]